MVLDAGHGGKEPGTTVNGTMEKTLTLRYASIVNELLQNHPDIKVYMNRGDDSTLPLEQRTLLTNEVEADMFISIHANYVDNKNINGVEIFYFADSPEARQLAQISLNNIAQYTGMAVTRGIKADRGYYVIRTSNMPAILIETGFMTNDSDYQRLISDEFAENMGKAIYLSILEAYDQVFY